MERICLFPGTFDPVTLGHTDIIDRALPLFDKIIVGIGLNAAKVPMFSADQRLYWIEEIYRNEPKVSGGIYEGLTVNYCQTIGAKFILRGIRYVSDFEYEKTIADANRTLGTTAIVITHNAAIAGMADTVIHLGDGTVQRIERNTHKISPSELSW